jgi:hypothetical protein
VWWDTVVIARRGCPSPVGLSSSDRVVLSRTRTCDTCSKPYFGGKTCASCNPNKAERDLMLWIIGVEIALLFLALAS